MALFFYVTVALIASCHARPESQVGSSNSSSYVCQSKYGYYSVDGSCDSYIQCNNNIPVRHTCPDGLHFNAKARYPSFPCGYPADVPCLEKAALRAAQPTSDCPHQYGFFPSPFAAPDNCGHFRVCVEGHALDMDCPTGLAFDPDSGRCDWPHLVPSCNAAEYLRFSCPEVDYDDDRIENFKYPGNCFYFYSCQGGQARLLSCDEGSAFDSALRRCVDEIFVNCASINNLSTAAIQ